MQEEIKKRTKQIGLEVIKLIDELPDRPSAWVIAKQILRSGTSIGANYRAACRAKSSANFTHKLKIVEEESDALLVGNARRKWLSYSQANSHSKKRNK